MDKRSIAKNIQDFIKICRRHQLKITPQRVAVYSELLKSDMHPSADAMYQIVKQDYPNISFDTVNRTLLTFASIGVANVVEIFGGAKRFDPDMTDHHHLHCIQCGKITDFHHRHFDNMEDPEDLPDDFRILDKRIILKGICHECSTDKPPTIQHHQYNTNKQQKGKQE